MNIQKHNPEYKLISVTINGKELVFGETNDGKNAGVEVYYLTGGKPANGHYYSRRFVGRAMPMIYDYLTMYLEKLLPYCPDGHKLELEGTEYNELVVLFNMQPRKQAA